MVGPRATIPLENFGTYWNQLSSREKYTLLYNMGIDPETASSAAWEDIPDRYRDELYNQYRREDTILD